MGFICVRQTFANFSVGKAPRYAQENAPYTTIFVVHMYYNMILTFNFFSHPRGEASGVPGVHRHNQKFEKPIEYIGIKAKYESIQ